MGKLFADVEATHGREPDEATPYPERWEVPVKELSRVELAAAVAYEILGWERTTDSARGVGGPIHLWVTPEGDEYSGTPEDGWLGCDELLAIVSDVRNAWRVAMLAWRQTRKGFNIRSLNDGWNCRFPDGGESYASIETVREFGPYSEESAAEAVCRASLETLRGSRQYPD